MTHQEVHFYDNEAGKILLNCGKEIKVDPRKYASTEEALDKLTDWARHFGYIGRQDVVAGYV